jgi:hypothetical protein
LEYAINNLFFMGIKIKKEQEKLPELDLSVMQVGGEWHHRRENGRERDEGDESTMISPVLRSMTATNWYNTIWGIATVFTWQTPGDIWIRMLL